MPAERRPASADIPVLPPSAAVLIADDDARFQEFNEAAVKLLKYAPAELKRMHVWDITPAPQRDAARLMWKEFISQGRQAGVYQVRRSDGREITVQYEATANFRPGRHISILQPASRALPESRPLDECPFDRPFPRDFDRCPAYEPRLVHISDSREQAVGQVWTCDHLATAKIPSQAAYYGRCALGDAPKRSAWLTVARRRGLLRLRELRMDFYRGAEAEIRQLLASQASLQAGSSKEDAPARSRAAGDLLLAALAAFIQRRRRDMIAASLEPAALTRAIEETLADGLRRHEVLGVRPPRRLITHYPLTVQAFLRPDLVAPQVMSRSTRS